MVVVFEYIISSRGITISFAGSPSNNANSIFPSSPVTFPSGSRKFDIIVKMVCSFIDIFVHNQMIIPAGIVM